MGESTGAIVGSVLLAMLNLSALIAAGAILSRLSVLDKVGRFTCSRLAFYLFAPCLLFNSITRTVGIDTVSSLWIFLAIGTIHVSLASLIGYMVTRFIFGVRSKERLSVTLSVALSNSGDIPLSLVSSLGGTVIFAEEEARHKAFGYIGIYLVVQNVFVGFASFFVKRAADRYGSDADADGEDGAVSDGMNTSSDNVAASNSASGNGEKKNDDACAAIVPCRYQGTSAAADANGSECRKRTYLAKTKRIISSRRASQMSSVDDEKSERLIPSGDNLEGPSFARKTSRGSGSDTADIEVEMAVLGSDGRGRAKTGMDVGVSIDDSNGCNNVIDVDVDVDVGVDVADDVVGDVGERDVSEITSESPPSAIKTILSKLINPLFLATTLGVVVGLITPIKTFIHPEHGDGSVISRFLDTVGSAHIPIAMMLVGALLSHGPRKGTTSTALVSAVASLRLIILPTINFVLAIVLLKSGVMDDDKQIMFVVATVISATPTASMVLILHESNKFLVHVLAPFYFYQYLFSIVTLTVFLFLGFHYVSSLD